MEICEKCGIEIPESAPVYIVDEGTDKERILCDACLDEELSTGGVVECVGCCGLFSNDRLSPEMIECSPFVPCPSCSKEIVDGLTREEFAEEHKPHRYAVIVSGPNSSRGYIVRARLGADPLKKLANKLDLKWTDTIHIAEVLLDEDEF